MKKGCGFSNVNVAKIMKSLEKCWIECENKNNIRFSCASFFKSSKRQKAAKRKMQSYLPDSRIQQNRTDLHTVEFSQPSHISALAEKGYVCVEGGQWMTKVVTRQWSKNIQFIIYFAYNIKFGSKIWRFNILFNNFDVH